MNNPQERLNKRRIMTRAEKKKLMGEIADTLCGTIQKSSFSVPQFYKKQKNHWQESEEELERGEKNDDLHDDLCALETIGILIRDTIYHYWFLKDAYKQLREAIPPKIRKTELNISRKYNSLKPKKCNSLKIRKYNSYK